MRSDVQWIADGRILLGALDAVPDGANLYVPFAGAGLAIWNAFPRGVRVFFDPRNDCYSAEAFREFETLSDPNTPAARRLDVIRRTGTTAAIVAASHPLAAALRAVPGWRRVAVPPLEVFVKR
jgi:hypothetical protein